MKLHITFFISEISINTYVYAVDKYLVHTLLLPECLKQEMSGD